MKSKKIVKKQEPQKFSPSVDYHEDLMNFLKNPKNATEYLNVAFEESLSSDKESCHLFLRALKNVAEAQGSISDLAKRTHLRRESLYRVLSENGNPKMQTLASLLGAMGYGLMVYKTDRK